MLGSGLSIMIDYGDVLDIILSKIFTFVNVIYTTINFIYIWTCSNNIGIYLREFLYFCFFWAEIFILTIPSPIDIVKTLLLILFPYCKTSSRERFHFQWTEDAFYEGSYVKEVILRRERISQEWSFQEVKSTLVTLVRYYDQNNTLFSAHFNYVLW